jgi:hypothetical protein
MDAIGTATTKRDLLKGVVAAVAAGAAFGGCATGRAQTQSKTPFFTVTFAEDGEVLSVERVDKKPVESWRGLVEAPIDGVTAINLVEIVTAKSTYVIQGGRRVCL